MYTLIYSADKIEKWCYDILLKCSFKSTDAKKIASVLVEADLRRVFTHGVAGGSGLDDIILKVKNKGIDTNYRLELNNRERKYPTIFNIDADGGPGHSVSMVAVKLVKWIARKYGNGKVYVYNSTHFGVAGLFSEMIAEDKDLIGKVTCITPAWMVPYEVGNLGGKKRYLGTNPIAWSTPYEDGIVTIDMSTSQRAASVALVAGKINSAKGTLSKQTVPSDYLIDYSGKEVGCPNSLDEVRGCSVLPLGGKAFGYKGFGLSVSIELEHVVGGCRHTVIQPGCKTSEGRVAQIFEATVIDSKDEKSLILSKLTKVVEEIKECGGKYIKLPGQIERENRDFQLKNGIVYSAEQIARLKMIGSEIGVPFE